MMAAMAKSLSCRDVGTDCDFTATADTEEELLRKVSQHAKDDHGFDGIPPELEEKVHAAIRTV